MGDRYNPMKFGPEWLRNYSRTRNGASGNSNNPNVNSGNSSSNRAASAAGSSGSSNIPTPGPSRENQPSQNSPKVQLAKLRYGREEMLALYDTNTEAPQELRNFDMIYQPRGNIPTALNTGFEERENIRSGQPLGGLPPGDRFGLGRGIIGRGSAGRGLGHVEGRGRIRGSFIRQPGCGRASWNSANPRAPVYNPSTNEEVTPLSRPWNPNSTATSSTRNTGEQTDWQITKAYRSRRPGNSANWRQVPRGDGEEWRSDAGRSKPQDKWDRDWGDRSAADKSQSWNSNRRTRVGGEAANTEENLPEWAMDNAVACSGTFDSTGAFHGYSNDDSNLPRNQDTTYPLTRSHTHGSFVRQKTVEDGSEGWWASDKAKKLSPKRFDAGDIKFKKPQDVGMSEAGPSTANKSTLIHSDSLDRIPVKESSITANYDESPQTSDYNGRNDKNAAKTFDSLMRSDINMEDANDERGNFQSVMITPNNSLRQKHQNIVLPINTAINELNRQLNVLHLPRTKNSSVEGSLESSNMSKDKIVDDIFELTLDEKTPTTTVSPQLNAAGPSGMPVSLAAIPLPRQLPNSMRMRLQNLPINQNNEPIMPIPIKQPIRMQSSMIQQFGITNSALNASLGLPLGGSLNLGMPLYSVPPPRGAGRGRNSGIGNAGTGNTGMGNAGIGNAGIGNAGIGNAGIGNAGIGNAGIGNSGIGNLGMENSRMGNSGMGKSGIGNSSMGNSGMGNTGMGNSSMGGSSLQNPVRAGLMQGATTGLLSLSSSLSKMSASDGGNNSLFLGSSSNNSSQMQVPNEFQLPNNLGPNMFAMHGLPQSPSPSSFGNSLYSNIMPRSVPNVQCNAHNMTELWYYEDPKQVIQGPFSSLEMFSWYRAGFFTSTLMVRRACEATMRPLGSYGPIVPFAQMDMVPYQLPGDNLLNNQQPGLGLGVESLWSQPSSSSDPMWLQHGSNSSTENRVNNLPMFFWDQQPSAMTSNSMLPEAIHKEMKTEDQILAQMRASQNISTPQTLSFMTDQQRAETSASKKPIDSFETAISATPNLEKLQKLLDEETRATTSALSNASAVVPEQPTEKAVITEPDKTEPVVSRPVTVTKLAETKPPKQGKNDSEKNSKKNEKVKNEKVKKLKEEKKEEPTEVKVKEKEKEETESEKQSAEPSPSKSKKEEKANKKDLEKEKKEMVKDGFTIVKGSEKNGNKDIKKKSDDIKTADELERKKKEEDKLAVVEEKKKKLVEAPKKQEPQLKQQQQQNTKQVSELVIKKAPWSAASNQAMQATNKVGPTLAEIQRLEREKKQEQIKEQQHMMQLIAQQQAAAMARDQEIQASLGWAKVNPTNNLTGQTLSEIQAEARKQTIAAAAVTVTAEQVPDDPVIPVSTPNVSVPWGGTTQNGGGFWDTQPNQTPKLETPTDLPKIPEVSKIKKKPNVITTLKKEASPAADFENWCSVELASWSSKIDVPTFIGFLKDIESPYEVKDYVKCYLGETKDSSDFARQFLERRSKLLRVGMVTPSDDLCSPAIAVYPRTISNSDYQEVKGKGKKIKKNRMFKVDARILGFSVTAAEDRINVGDIDSV